MSLWSKQYWDIKGNKKALLSTDKALPGVLHLIWEDHTLRIIKEEQTGGNPRKSNKIGYSSRKHDIWEKVGRNGVL